MINQQWLYLTAWTSILLIPYDYFLVVAFHPIQQQQQKQRHKDYHGARNMIDNGFFGNRFTKNTNCVYNTQRNNHFALRTSNKLDDLVQTILYMGANSRTQSKDAATKSWFPKQLITASDIENIKNNSHPFQDVEDDDGIETLARENLQSQSLTLASDLIRQRLQKIKNENKDKFVLESTSSSLSTLDNSTFNEQNENNPYRHIIKGRFADLTCSAYGEQILENLFNNATVHETPENIVRGTIIAIQSLLVYGYQLGVTGEPEDQLKSISHLYVYGDENETDIETWDENSIRRLKHKRTIAPAVQLLATLLRKRSPLGAFSLLVDLQVWSVHEDLPLIRSGFPLRFTEAEEQLAKEAALSTHDLDALLGIRKDMTDMKSYTIDSSWTTDMDDALGVEVIETNNGVKKHRLWIHIADVERLVRPNSGLWNAAKRRLNSLYFPSGAVHMLPTSLSTGSMSLTTGANKCAVSLGVEIFDDGSINEESIFVVPSTIEISYRLTYDEVDEMLQEGIGYREEWELGALLSAAKKRREYRIRNGSQEGAVPKPLPKFNIYAYKDSNSPGGYGIKHTLEATHNSGQNQTERAGAGDQQVDGKYDLPVSSASLLVTEMMILAGEAIGKWKIRIDETQKGTDDDSLIPNSLKMAFRCQPPPNYRSRGREKRILDDLLKNNIGGGFCHGWYARRFFVPVKVSEFAAPHTALGVSCYVHWSSPIRRFGDLQVHCAVKRYLRREHINKLFQQGAITKIPDFLTINDLGIPSPKKDNNNDDGDNNVVNEIVSIDDDIDFKSGSKLVTAGNVAVRESNRYWLYEYIRRLVENDPERRFTALVLGNIDPEKSKYAIYFYELGFERKYTSPVGLYAGEELIFKFTSVIPRNDRLILQRVNI